MTDTLFGPANLPYGVFSVGDGPRRIGVALGDDVLDIAPLLGAEFAGLVDAPLLNPLLAAGRSTWSRLRERVRELVTTDAIRQTREAYLEDGLRERMARHHDDPDAAFRGWCDVWLDPGFASWSLEEEAGALVAPALLVQGADDPYGTLDQLDRIEASAKGRVERLVVPGGHSPHLEQPDAVLEAVARFTGELP